MQLSLLLLSLSLSVSLCLSLSLSVSLSLSLCLSTLSFWQQVNNFVLLCPFTVFEQTEAVVHRGSVKNVFLKISQNSQENICARFCFNFIKKETLAQLFPCEFCKIFQNTSFQRTALVAASEPDFCLTDFIPRGCKTQRNIYVSPFSKSQ